MLKSALLAKLNVETKHHKSANVKKKSASEVKKVTSKTKSSSEIKKITPKTTKVRNETEPVSEYNFDEEILELGAKFRVDPKCVKKGLESLVKLTSENPKLKNKLFDDEEFPLFLQVNSIKVPKGHPKIVRIPLKHSLLTPDSEVCLIVADVKGIPNKKHEEHLEHYEKLLRQKGVDNIKKIMTFHEFRTEYETFELKNRLVELYDAFLVDGKISGKTVRKCGKIFYKKRKVPTAIKLRATKLKEHIEQTLSKTPLYLHGKGDSFMVQIGHSKMKAEELVENVYSIMQGLEKEFPGGFGNIRNLNLLTSRGLAIPIYTTLKNKNEVHLSQSVKEIKKAEAVSGELTTRLNAIVRVEPTGEVEVFKLNKNKEASSNLKATQGLAGHREGSKKRKSNSHSISLKTKKKRKGATL